MQAAVLQKIVNARYGRLIASLLTRRGNISYLPYSKKLHPNFLILLAAGFGMTNYYAYLIIKIHNIGRINYVKVFFCDC